MGIDKLYIEPSTVCNLNCSMCFRHNWFDEKLMLMDNSIVCEVIKTLNENSFKDVFFGGIGEPLMHPHIYEMIKAAKKNSKKVELITNATLLDISASQRLIDAGLDMLWVSVDGFSRESYENIRRGSMYDKITQNLKAFNSIRKKAKLGITFVIMKENEAELNMINSFCDDFNVDFINLSHVVPGEELNEDDALYNSKYRIGKITRFDPNKEYSKHPDICPFINDNACFIRYDGNVCPCMQLLHNSYTYLYREKRKVYSWSYGNISEKPIYEIYNSNDYKAFRKRVTDFDFPCCTVCLGCDDRKENITDCMGNISPTCGACLWAQGYIRCP